MHAEMRDIKAELKTDVKSLRADVASDLVLLRAELKADIARMRKELGEQIGGLRRAVMEYHSSIVGHGMLISDLEDRVRRVEQHLDLPPQGAH